MPLTLKPLRPIYRVPLRIFFFYYDLSVAFSVRDQMYGIFLLFFFQVFIDIVMPLGLGSNEKFQINRVTERGEGGGRWLNFNY